MSRIILVTFSDASMSISKELCVESALKHGCTHAWPQNPDTISYEFKQVNRDIWQPGNRGADCFWLFKPYIIYKGMLQMQDGEVLIYADAGVEFINDVQHIISRMDENVFLFTNTHPNHHWTKRETLEEMMPGFVEMRDADYVWPQVQASVIFFRICKETIDFVKRWLLWCQMPGIIDDVKGDQKRYFQDHRHDQSVLTCLATKYVYKLHWWPTAYAEHIRVPGDTYPVMFNHHRKRNHEW
jgi:hypothetical protein